MTEIRCPHCSRTARELVDELRDLVWALRGEDQKETSSSELVDCASQMIDENLVGKKDE